MGLSEITRKHVIERYVAPARLRGDSTVQVRVGDVLKELGWTNRTPSVFSTLSSRVFQREAGVELIEKRGGPASGGPSTTVQFVFRIASEDAVAGAQAQTEKLVRSGAGLEKLYGILKDVYAAYGGGEAYLKAERNWGPDPWERYESEERATREKSA